MLHTQLVQGVRPKAVTANDQWMPELYLRATGQLARLKSSRTTSGAEHLFDIPASTYYYVGRPHPHFGELITHTRLVASAGSPRARVSPFDTGGLATNQIALEADATPAEILRRYSFRPRWFAWRFWRWIGSAFDDASAYVRGQRPRRRAVPEFDLDACADQAWTWEYRIPKDEIVPAVLTPWRLYISEGKLDGYMAWLQREMPLEGQAMAEHLSWIGDRVREVPSPVESMISSLTSGDHV